jgi:hypothetical protein
MKTLSNLWNCCTERGGRSRGGGVQLELDPSRFYEGKYLSGHHAHCDGRAAWAAELVRKHPLLILERPVRIPGFTMCQGRHEIHGNDPGNRWLRDAFIDAAKGRVLS